MNWSLLTQFVDANKLGGWVRALVGAGFVAAIAKWPVLGTYVDPGTQVQIAAAVATIVIGLWSQLTKTDKAKVQAAAAVVGPEGKPTIVVTSSALAASTPENNIVSHDDVKVVQK